jgi:hypothetical protein
MKTTLFLLFAIIMVFLVSQVQGTDWVSVYTHKDGSGIFYNRESVEELPDRIMKVWEKWEFSDEGRSEFIRLACKFLGSCDGRFDTLGYSLVLFEVNCPKKEVRLMADSYHSTDGQVLKSLTSEPSEWEAIAPGSMDEGLYNAVCPPQEKK